MTTKDDNFEQKRAALVERHRRGLEHNPISGPPDVGVAGGVKPSEFFELLGDTAQNYTPSDFQKKLPP